MRGRLMTRAMSILAFTLTLSACGSLDQESLEASFPTVREAYIDCRYSSEPIRNLQTSLYHYARDRELVWLDTPGCFQARADVLECILQDVDVCTAGRDSEECKTLGDTLYVECFNE